jgi:hypothetical protein
MGLGLQVVDRIVAFGHRRRGLRCISGSWSVVTAW